MIEAAEKNLNEGIESKKFFLLYARGIQQKRDGLISHSGFPSLTTTIVSGYASTVLKNGDFATYVSRH